MYASNCEKLGEDLSNIVVSVSGKGGVGKTAVTALILKVLLEKREGPILVVDADPATNLPDVLGVEVPKTVGDVATKLKRSIEMDKLPPGVSKGDLLESWIFETLVEGDDFDLLAMGRTEGEGCYCFVNSLLTRILDKLTSNYKITLMDMEAGLEHLSRRTDRDVDIMLIVTDPSKMGFETAKRIREITEEVHIDVKELYLIGNMFPRELENIVRRKAHEIGVKYGGVIPRDPNIAIFNLEGKPLLELPPESPSVVAARRIAGRIGLVPDTTLLELLGVS